MNITLQPADSFDYIKNLFQYYIYDMSESMGWSPDESGTFNIDSAVADLLAYWEEPEHYPYLILVDDDVAGFSLIRKYPGSEDVFDIGQFFVMRKYKRKGVGTLAFKLSVSKHPGKWITRVLPDNVGAKSFWIRVIRSIAVTSMTVNTEFYRSTTMDFIRYTVPAPDIAVNPVPVSE